MDFWDLIHPLIIAISKSRFDTEHYADSVEASMKEVNTRVKEIVRSKTNQEYDGVDLMNRAFSPNNPIIKFTVDLTNETGRNMQIGYMNIFSGSMSAIRNPKAHGNLIIEKERAIHFLFLASLLMFKLDETEIMGV